MAADEWIETYDLAPSRPAVTPSRGTHDVLFVALVALIELVWLAGIIALIYTLSM